MCIRDRIKSLLGICVRVPGGTKSSGSGTAQTQACNARTLREVCRRQGESSRCLGPWVGAMAASDPAHGLPERRNVYDATRQDVHAATTDTRLVLSLIHISEPTR